MVPDVQVESVQFRKGLWHEEDAWRHPAQIESVLYFLDDRQHNVLPEKLNS